MAKSSAGATLGIGWASIRYFGGASMVLGFVSSCPYLSQDLAGRKTSVA
jgi:hypothetical protein